MNQPRDLVDIRIDLSCCRVRHACALCMFLLVYTPLAGATSSLAHSDARHVDLAQSVSIVCSVPQWRPRGSISIALMSGHRIRDSGMAREDDFVLTSCRVELQYEISDTERLYETRY